MIRKILLIIFLVLFCGSLLGIFCSYLPQSSPSKKAKWALSFGFPVIEKIKFNQENQIIKKYGLNLAIGYSQFNYFKPLKNNRLYFYWHFGTILLIIPYIGIGSEYYFNNIFIGWGTFYFIPNLFYIGVLI